MTLLVSSRLACRPGSHALRTWRALSPEGAGLALFVGLAICLVIAALALALPADPIDLHQVYRMVP